MSEPAAPTQWVQNHNQSLRDALQVRLQAIAEDLMVLSTPAPETKSLGALASPQAR